MKHPGTKAFLLTCCLAGSTAGASPADDLINEYGSAGAGPFTEAAGRVLWSSQHPGKDGPRSCTTCHTQDPRRPGQHKVTGKDIQPMAPSTNPKRLSVRREIEKWLQRNCKWTLGRECTAQEKGDLLTYLKAQ